MYSPETANDGPQPGPFQGGMPVIDDDSFLSGLKQPTEGDNRPNSGGPAPEPAKPSKPEITDTTMVAKLMVSTLDVGIQIACQTIAKEPEQSLFKVSESQKAQIEKPLAELLEYYKIMLNPWWLLALAVVAVYAPPVSQAVGISLKKSRIKKAAEARSKGQTVVEPVVEVKRSPGRPSGTTKEQIALNKNLEKKKGK